jgi:hypothetical protein
VQTEKGLSPFENASWKVHDSLELLRIFMWREHIQNHHKINQRRERKKKFVTSIVHLDPT